MEQERRKECKIVDEWMSVKEEGREGGREERRKIVS